MLYKTSKIFPLMVAGTFLWEYFPLECIANPVMAKFVMNITATTHALLPALPYSTLSQPSYYYQP